MNNNPPKKVIWPTVRRQKISVPKMLLPGAVPPLISLLNSELIVNYYFDTLNICIIHIYIYIYIL
jgi:hypothetical protein